VSGHDFSRAEPDRNENQGFNHGPPSARVKPCPDTFIYEMASSRPGPRLR